MNRIIEIFIIILTASASIFSFFSVMASNDSLSCQSNKVDYLFELQHYANIQNAGLSASITAQMVGKADKNFLDFLMPQAAKTQEQILNVLKDKTCNNFTLLSQAYLIIAVVFNCAIILIIMISSLSLKKKRTGSFQQN